MNVIGISAKAMAILGLCILLCGPAFSTVPCQSIADDITDLKAEVLDLQSQLQNAGPSEKPAIAAQIKKLNNQITGKQAELKKCQSLAGSPTGGEKFPIHGGLLFSASNVAQSVSTCPPPSPLSPFLPQPPPAPLNASPLPTAGWRASSCTKGDPADAQIAVSSSHVVVTFENSMAWYDKTGVKQGELTNFALFKPLLSQLAQSVGMAGGDDCYPFAVAPQSTCARTQSDFRVLFDEYRHRFWAIDGAGVYTADWVFNLDGTMARDPKKQRGIILLAVSLTEDPKDGWYLYWWDAVAHWGAANDAVYQPGDGGDYPSIGIDPAGFYQTNRVCDINVNCKYTHLVAFPAAGLVLGTPVDGWHYFDLQDPAGHTVTNTIQPAVHHGSNGSTLFVSTYGTDQVLVWALRNLLKPAQDIQRVAVTLVDKQGSVPFNPPQNAPELNGASPIEMTNLGNDILKVVYRAGGLVFVANDAEDALHKGKLLSSIRLVRLPVLTFPNIPTLGDPSYVNTRFGNLSWDDHAGEEMHGGWTAAEYNKSLNVAVVYARSGATIYPEVRYNALLNKDTAARPSRLLKAGDAAYRPGGCGLVGTPCRWGDTAGAALDPSDDTSIWLAQQYANFSGGWDIWVARIF